MAFARELEDVQTEKTVLALVRKRRGISLIALAQEVGSDKGNLSRIERGRIKPGLKLAKRISDYFGPKVLSRDELLYPELHVARTTKKPPRSADVQEAR